MKKAKPVGAASGFMLAAMIAAGIAAGGVWAEEPHEHGVARAVAERGFQWKDGAEVYNKVCAYCHEAQVGPQIRGRQLDPAYIRSMVRHGNRAMPAFRASEIDDAALAKLADYVSKH